MSNLLPSAVVTPSHLVSSGATVPEAYPNVGHLTRVVPGNGSEYINLFYYSTDLRAHQPEVIANEIHSHPSEKKIHPLEKHYRIPAEVELLVSRRVDTILNTPISFYVAYLDQFKVGLRFPLIPLLIEILKHYDISLSQFVPNAIRVIVGFEWFCRSKGLVSSLVLFRSIFMLKSSLIQGCYHILPRLNCELKVSIPSKNAKGKDFFVSSKILDGVVLPKFWWTRKLMDTLKRIGVPEVSIL